MTRQKKTSQVPRFRFKRRRVKYALTTIVALVLIGIVVGLQSLQLEQSSFTSGYVLLGSLVFLMLLGMRKRFIFLPAFGSASFWMQMHIYVGLGSVAVFLMHVGLRIPDGMLERCLAVLYCIVAFSGFYGLYISRTVPQKLTAINEEVIYERIPMLRSQVQKAARAIILEACKSSEVLANFYHSRLAAFLERPRGLAYVVRPSGRMRRQLIGEMEDLDRYLAEDQRQLSRKLAVLVRKKDDLDFHQAMQGRLKVWLFVHIGFTYSLLIVALVHGVVAHAFHGGL